MPQLNDDVEVFLVDDGCHEERLDKYKGKINITHLEENGGNSVALNTGIKKAQGKYVGIIDSDDMITDDYVSTLLNAIDKTDADLIYLDWKDIHSFVEIHRPDNLAPWRSIYKREIMPLFDESVRYSSDVPFQNAVESQPRTRYYTDKVLYIYNSGRPGSLTIEKERLIKEGKL